MKYKNLVLNSVCRTSILFQLRFLSASQSFQIGLSFDDSIVQAISILVTKISPKLSVDASSTLLGVSHTKRCASQIPNQVKISNGNNHTNHSAVLLDFLTTTWSSFVASSHEIEDVLFSCAVVCETHRLGPRISTSDQEIDDGLRMRRSSWRVCLPKSVDSRGFIEIAAAA